MPIDPMALLAVIAEQQSRIMELTAALQSAQQDTPAQT